MNYSFDLSSLYKEKYMKPLEGNEVINEFTNKAKIKANTPFKNTFLLSVLGGAFIAMGYLAYIRIYVILASQSEGLGLFLGACIFPIGLIAIYLMGAELITGNTLTMTLGFLDKKIKFKDIIINWTIVAIGNIIGAVIIAYLFGHIVGLTEGSYLATTIKIALGKVEATGLAMIISGIGGNIFVSLAVWLATSSKTYAGKIFGLWLPVMIFIIIGFQHSVANAFVIPAAIFSGQSTISIIAFAINFIYVLIGNIIGGALIIALPVFISNRKCNGLNNCQLPYYSND